MSEKKLFYKFLLANYLLVPFLISPIWMVVNRSIWTSTLRSFGFSGIVSAFFGSLIFAYVLYLSKTLKVNSFYAYLSSMSLVALLFASLYFTTNMVPVTGAFFAFFVWSAYKTLKSVDQQAKTELMQRTTRPVIVKLTPSYLYVLVFFLGLSLFPAQFIQGNTAINFIVHYEGFIMGIGISYLIHSIDLIRAKTSIA